MCVVQRAYKPVLSGFSGQRSVCFLAKFTTQESEKMKNKVLETKRGSEMR